jgi:undecaprenyl-diphosphatase
MIKKKTRYISFIVLGALLLNALLGEVVLKNLIQRARPFAGTTKESLLIAKPLSYSFPSGHTASSFAAAGVLSCYFKKYAPVFFILASLIAFSRLYLYVHYPTDVLGGIILGLISSRIAIYAFSSLKNVKGREN